MPDDRPPYSHKISVATLKPGGETVSLTPDEADRGRIAAAIGVPSIEASSAQFSLTPRGPGLVHVEGRVVASLHQICVVSLDPFPVVIDEPVDLDFADEPVTPKAAAKKTQAAEIGHDLEEPDPPDPIVDGAIDLGALLVEFVALGLDPFPRKPGVSFDFKDPADTSEHPLAGLAALKRDGGQTQ